MRSNQRLKAKINKLNFMKIGTIDKIKLRKKEKTFRKLGKAIFEKAENPKSALEIRKSLTTLLFELNLYHVTTYRPQMNLRKRFKCGLKLVLTTFQL